MHQRDRGDAADRLLKRRPTLTRPDPPRLQPQQGGDGLQVVLHPVMHLANGGVFGQQLPLTAAQLGDVPQQQHRPGPLAVPQQRDRPHRQGGATGLQITAPWGPAGQHQGQRLVDRSAGGIEQRRDHRRQRLVHQVADVAEPVHRRQRVRAGVPDPAVTVEPEQTVADPGGPPPGAGRRAGHREVAGGHHQRQVVGALQVGQLQPARRPGCGQVGVARDHREHPAAMQHRNRLAPDRDVVVPLRLVVPHDPSQLVGPVQVGPLGRHPGANHVVVVDRRAGARPAVRHRYPTAGRLAHPEHQVGERQVRHQLPVADQLVEPLDRRRAQIGRMQAHQVVQARHDRQRRRVDLPAPWAGREPAVSGDQLVRAGTWAES